MNKHRFYSQLYSAVLIVAGVMVTSSFATYPGPASKGGVLKLTFVTTANGKPVVLRDSMYSNAFGEQYSISKLKYYISNVSLKGVSGNISSGGYYLVNAALNNNSFYLSLPQGKYSGIHFVLGVDSLHNCSGAQSGALDPVNDMFWTWNSGYVMFKLEGSSSSSTADLQRIEYHVAGYKYPNNVVTGIDLDFAAATPVQVAAGDSTELVIETNLDKYWQGRSAIKISEFPVCVTTGKLALKIAGNFENIFSVKNIQAFH